MFFFRFKVSVFSVEATRWGYFYHMNDNTLSNKDDKLFKLKTVADTVKEKFLAIPMDESFCVDKQTCASPYEAVHVRKAHKHVFQLFILAGVSGFA